MFGGLTVALVTGVPLGTFIGQHFGWRETFLAVSLLGVIALMSSQLLIPANIPGHTASIRDRESTDSSSSVADLRRYGAGLRRGIHGIHLRRQ